MYHVKTRGVNFKQFERYQNYNMSKTRKVLSDEKIKKIEATADYVDSYIAKNNSNYTRLAEDFECVLLPKKTVRAIRNNITDLRTKPDKTEGDYKFAQSLKNFIDHKENPTYREISDDEFYNAIDSRQDDQFSEKQKNHIKGNYLIVRYAASDISKVVVSHFSIFGGDHANILKFNSHRINPTDHNFFKTTGFVTKNKDSIFAFGKSFYAEGCDRYTEVFNIRSNQINAKTPMIGVFSGISLHQEMTPFLAKFVLFKIDETLDGSFKCLKDKKIFGMKNKDSFSENPLLQEIISPYRIEYDDILSNITFSKEINLIGSFTHARKQGDI